MRKIFIISLFTVFLILPEVKAQYYLQSAGIRMGGTSGITYKKFFNESEAVEVLLSGRKRGVQVNLLYQKNRNLQRSISDNFFIYFGAGGHIGIEKMNRWVTYRPIASPAQFEVFETNKTFFVMGIDGIAGIEYRFLGFPVTLGLDIKPYLNYAGMRYLNFTFWDTSFSIKYTF